VSGIGDADLVPVRSRDELRAGMTVVVKGCSESGCDDGVHAMVLTRPIHYVLIVGHRDKSPCPAKSGWYAAPEFHGSTGWCFCDALKTGRLFRLRDLDDAEEEGRRIACDIDDRRRATQPLEDEYRRRLSRERGTP
jgi:hypothetical protein